MTGAAILALALAIGHATPTLYFGGVGRGHLHALEEVVFATGPSPTTPYALGGIYLQLSRNGSDVAGQMEIEPGDLEVTARGNIRLKKKSAKRIAAGDAEYVRLYLKDEDGLTRAADFLPPADIADFLRISLASRLRAFCANALKSLGN